MLLNHTTIDLAEALKMLHGLQLNSSGDLEHHYWYEIEQLLVWANEKRNAELQIAKTELYGVKAE